MTVLSVPLSRPPPQCKSLLPVQAPTILFPIPTLDARERGIHTPNGKIIQRQIQLKLLRGLNTIGQQQNGGL